MEMNMHMPQNVLAETELKHLAAIPYQMISPSANAPIIGIYQDSLLGSYRFTRPNINLTPRDAMNLLMMYNKVDVEAIRNNADSLTSFDVLSQIIAPITLKYKTKLFEDNPIPNNVLEIRNGKYISGQLEKSVLASTTKGIIHRVCNDYGNMAASNFIDDLQNIVTEYMKSSSFSVGISDLIANKKTQDSIAQIINEKKLEVHSVIEKVHLGIFENNTSSTNMVEFETRLNNILNKATDLSGKEGRKSLSKDNRFLMIVNSGSKGSLVNISQMISCLGQQNVDGKRIPYGFDNRTLPHYSKFDDSPAARGFIENSYISGLTAPELFFHAMGGRIGLIDTACKTSSTGYIQRRLIKGLEDLKVEYDMTVRNNKGKIVQFAYGDDGFDSTKAENQIIPLVGMSVEDIYMHYDIIGVNGEKSDLLNIYEKGTMVRMRKQQQETMKKCKYYIDKMIEYRTHVVEAVFQYKNENTVKVPVAFQNIIANIQGQLNLNSNSTVDITPLEAFELIEAQYKILENLHFSKPTKLFEILYYYYLSPKDLLVNKRFHRKALIYLLETITLKYKQALVHPGEMVGVIAGQSIGEPTTQLTLNSVIYETEIIVRNNKNEIKKVSIGDFTKEHISKSSNLEYMSDKDTTYAELSTESEYYEIPCANETGETLWKRIEAVTQHPVINQDGTNTMLKIITKGCREVIATKAKSFLQLVDGKIIGVNGKDLKVGDYLPVSKKQLDFKFNYEIDLKEYLPPSEYLYGCEYKKAKNVMNEHHWWKKHSGKTFILPHSRSDSFVSLQKSNKNINENCVYMKLVNMCNYNIPDKIQLDYDFGYLIGAYCAEGCMTKHQISISNNDLEYLRPIERLCEKYNISTKIYKVSNKIQNGWVSQDIRIYNTILCRIIEKLCGKLSHNKFVSEKIIFSNPECMTGFLDAYIAGDGCIAKSSYSKKPVSIDITSVSLRMLTDIMILLKNIGIHSNIHKPTKIQSNNRGSKHIKQHYVLNIKNKQSQKLCEILNLPIKSKQQNIESLLKQTFKYEYNKEYLTIPNIVNGETIMQERKNTMSDLVFDQIISIEEVENTTSYAYDLTVEDTRNFDIYNGLCLRDTFHLAGVASKSNVTRGVPRIEEILRLTKNPKNPSLTVFLKSIDETDQEKATTYANMLEHTKLIDVVKAVQIYFDPIENATFIEPDKGLIDQFYEFEQFMKDCTETVDDPTQKSKWIIRLEIDAEKLLDKNITMDDIHFAITNSYPNEIKCAYSDYNDNNLVFRIRMNSDIFKKKSGGAESLDQSDKIYLLKSFQDTLLNNIVLRGVSGIQNVLPRKLQNMVVKEDGKYVRKDVWILDTTGSNLLEILGSDFIDKNRTFSNDIKEVFDVLGIEAARQVVYNEFVDVMEFSDVYINYHHLSLLCDRMTMTKNMVPIFRSGILNDDIGPIAKATFEVHTEVFLNAARHADFDSMRGVSANVMCGQYGYYGTNSFNLLMDMKEMVKLQDVTVDVKDTNEEIEKQFGFGEESSSGCSSNDIMIRNNISAIQKENIGICTDNYDFGL
jgi:DNA-directed RNA polymerase beta' subunit